MFQFLLRVEFDRQFAKDYCIVADRPLVGPALDLLAGSFKPILVLCENVRNDTGVHQNHAAPRVKRSQLSVSPLTFPPLNNVASTRSPRESFPALTTSTPSGWSTNLTSRRGSSPCFRRMAGGIVTWPLSVIFMRNLSLNHGAKSTAPGYSPDANVKLPRGGSSFAPGDGTSQAKHCLCPGSGRESLNDRVRTSCNPKGERTRPRVQWSAPSPTTKDLRVEQRLAIRLCANPTGEGGSTRNDDPSPSLIGA
jgi:hypothetical protein